MAEPAPGPEPRGVHNPRVVDLIARDPEDGAVELWMLESRAWGSEPGQLAQLEAKFNAYLGYVQLGYLVRDYPDYHDRPVRFHLACAEPPSGEAAGMLDAMRHFAAGEGIAFAVEVSGDAAALASLPPRR